MIDKDVVRQLSNELGLSPDTVHKVYKSYWQAIKNIIEDLPLMEDLSEERFSLLKTNFNLPSLGKLSCTFDKYKAIKTRYNNNRNA